MPVLPPDVRLFKKHILRVVLAISLILVAIVGWIVYDKFFRTIPQSYIAGSEEAFKYGSIGVEEEEGIPYWIWLVLPRIFPEHLPGSGGYASIGLVWEQGKEVPVGFSKKRIGYDRVAFNCALCHTSTYRLERDDDRPGKTQIVAGGAATRLDAQAYIAFLGRCARDPRFNADTILESIDYNIKLSALDRALYRHILIPATKKAILKQAAESEWMRSRPVWGHGRIDPFNPVKFGMLEMDLDDTVGNSDMMPLWELDKRQAKDGSWNLHWDGLSTNPEHSSLAGALGDGASRKSIPEDNILELVKSFKGVNGAITKFSPPPSPYLKTKPNAKDLAAISSGKEIFTSHCSICHAQGEKFTNTVIKVGKEEPIPSNTVPFFESGQVPYIGTDTNRLSMWNPYKSSEFAGPTDDRHPAARYNKFADGYLPTFVVTDGYVAVPLNGIWLRSPYLHNGSVPTLEDLLNKPMDQGDVEKTLGKFGVDFAGLVDRFSQIGNSETPPEIASAQLNRLVPLVDKMIAAARATDKRPAMFYRGSDILESKMVGFICDSRATKNRKLPIPYLTAVQGNGNQGHLWGTDLSKTEKQQLIEYLKTL